MRVVFLGSSGFSVPSFRVLAAGGRHELVGVAAQPDRPSGRNRQVQRGVIHQAALDAGVPVMTPEKIGGAEAMAQLAAWRPEVIAVASFGQYIPTRVLAFPRCGVINVHPSLLPKYRGAAPLQWSIAEGETESGVTIFRVVQKMDAGDVILQERYPVFPGDTAATLSSRFAELGAELMIKALDLLEEGRAPAVPQDEAAATYAPKISKMDGWIDWAWPSARIVNRVRGFQPWPCAYIVHQGQTIKVWRAEAADGAGRPGEVLSVRGDGPVVAVGEGAVRLLEVQPEGKKIMSGAAFLCGHAWSVGSIVDGRKSEGII
ncbi:MAG TPA: methionyl-tRNA formyltransferase [Kiritimatiellia bacterium]|nr:methionyl-tRNA formyltransferase [Kiritimatiellia bacterium]HMP34566.1 methionyl-tRNA formyltransferase [Kiritimatiellia bacterium]